ncbi:MAG: hypothetical protein JWM76_3892 [Pseudonocardiales bacterium]|nr:hypothetical protein [Pseudonocardiales bacterium]
MPVHSLPQPGCSRRELIQGIGLGGLGLMVATLAGCSTTNSRKTSSPDGSTSSDHTIPTAAPHVERPDPSVIHEVTSYGAVGDGTTDDTAAIAAGLLALRPGEALRFGAGKTFCHSNVLSVKTNGVQLLGPGTLRATVESRSALKIEASDVIVDGLVLSVSKTTKRWSTPDQHKLVLGPYAGISISTVMITGSAAAGVFCQGTSNFVLRDIHVSDTRADGIHMTAGCQNGSVESPLVTRSGDDGVAVVSYFDDHDVCRKITISAPRIRTTTGGRGISVVGGEDIIYRDIDVDGSNAAAVYIACEGAPSNTRPAVGIRVSGGRVTDANRNSAIDHGAVLVYSGRSVGNVSDVVISGLSVSGTRAGASRQIGVIADGGDPISSVRFEKIELAAEPTPYQGNAPVKAVTLAGVTAAGRSVRMP